MIGWIYAYSVIHSVLVQNNLCKALGARWRCQTRGIRTDGNLETGWWYAICNQCEKWWSMRNMGFLGSATGKESTYNAGDIRDAGLIPWLGKSPWGGHSNPLQYSCLENPMDRGAWWFMVHRIRKNRTRLKRLSTHAHEKHSKNTRPAWRIKIREGNQQDFSKQDIKNA